MKLLLPTRENLSKMDNYDNGKMFDLMSEDLEDHQMKILHDDGTYRHLRFNNPNNGFYWFEIITSPNFIAVNGDMGGYIFNPRSGTEELSHFIKHEKIDSDYWLRRSNHERKDLREFSMSSVRNIFTNIVDEYDGSVNEIRNLRIVINSALDNMHSVHSDSSFFHFLENFHSEVDEIIHDTNNSVSISLNSIKSDELDNLLNNLRDYCKNPNEVEGDFLNIREEFMNLIGSDSVISLEVFNLLYQVIFGSLEDGDTLCESNEDILNECMRITVDGSSGVSDYLYDFFNSIELNDITKMKYHFEYSVACMYLGIKTYCQK